MAVNKSNKHKYVHILYRADSAAPVKCERKDWKRCPEHKHLADKPPKFVAVQIDFDDEVIPAKVSLLSKVGNHLTSITRVGMVASAALWLTLVGGSSALPVFVTVVATNMLDLAGEVADNVAKKLFSKRGVSKTVQQRTSRWIKAGTIVGGAGLTVFVGIPAGVVSLPMAGTIFGVATGIVLLSSLTDRISKKYTPETYEKTLFSSIEKKIENYLDKTIDEIEKVNNGKINRSTIVKVLGFVKAFYKVYPDGTAIDAKEAISETVTLASESKTVLEGNS